MPRKPNSKACGAWRFSDAMGMHEREYFLNAFVGEAAER